MALKRYRVVRGHLHRPGVHCSPGHVLELDSSADNVRRAVQLRQLEETTAELRGGLVFLRQKPAAPAAALHAEAVEAAAQLLVDMTVPQLELEVQEAPAAVLAKAVELEAARDKPRATALAALEAELTGRED